MEFGILGPLEERSASGETVPVGGSRPPPGDAAYGTASTRVESVCHGVEVELWHLPAEFDGVELSPAPIPQETIRRHSSSSTPTDQAGPSLVLLKPA
jgi:hypothetical protein